MLSSSSHMGTLYYGDNLDILTRYIADESVDLVYLDPPFNSARDYNAFFEEKDGTAAAAQIQAFKDTWEWNNDSRTAYEELSLRADNLGSVMRAFMEILGPTDMMAYLAMMAPRLVELHRVLKTTGSLYLHCDPTASHYLKLLLDAVFGKGCFRNEIIWSYRRWPTPAKFFQRMHDTLLFYTREQKKTHTFHTEYEANSKSYAKRFKGNTQILDPILKTKKIPVDEPSRGLPRRDVWELSILAGSSKERLGYPTQKPVALLERIILASSNPGDVVLDPFCGCGTSVDAAQKHGRQWIGIDITHLAITLIKSRLRDTYGADLKMKVLGEPTDLAGARALAAENKYQFQWWALGLVGARPAEEKKGADGGVDGKILFRDAPDPKQKPQTIIFSVKGGGVGVKDVRDLDSVVTKTGAAIGVLISIEEPTKPMREWAANTGNYASAVNGAKFPRIQLRTIGQLLAGVAIERPSGNVTVDVTFKNAPKAKGKAHPELGL